MLKFLSEYHYPKAIPVLIVLLCLYLIKYFTLIVYKKRNNIKKKDNFIVGINSMYYIFVVVLLVILALMIVGVSFREFFTSISIIAAAIAIVSKDYIAQVVNGMILMFNNQFSIGDFIRIGMHKGAIINISLLNIQIVNDENNVIYIPNTVFLSSDVINYTKTDSYVSKVDFLCNMNKIETIESLEQLFLKNKHSLKADIVEGSFEVEVLGAKRETLRFRVQAKLKNYTPLAEKNLKTEISNMWLKEFHV